MNKITYHLGMNLKSEYLLSIFINDTMIGKNCGQIMYCYIYM